MTTQQPEVLRREYRATMPPEVLHLWAADALACIASLEAQLEAVGASAGGVGPLIACAGFDASDMATAAAQGFRDGVASVSAGWQSIETAPKDGSYLLLWEQYSDAPFVGYWSGGSWSVSHEHVYAEGGWDGANVVDALSMPITHWMPIPAPPASAEGVEHG